jgi:hypothetical protein
MTPKAWYRDRVISSLAAGERVVRGRDMPRPYKGAM